MCRLVMENNEDVYLEVKSDSDNAGRVGSRLVIGDGADNVVDLGVMVIGDALQIFNALMDHIFGARCEVMSEQHPELHPGTVADRVKMEMEAEQRQIQIRQMLESLGHSDDNGIASGLARLLADVPMAEETIDNDSDDEFFGLYL